MQQSMSTISIDKHLNAALAFLPRRNSNAIHAPRQLTDTLCHVNCNSVNSLNVLLLRTHVTPREGGGFHIL